MIEITPSFDESGIVNPINAHTTDAKNAILAALAAVPGGASNAEVVAAVNAAVAELATYAEVTSAKNAILAAVAALPVGASAAQLDAAVDEILAALPVGGGSSGDTELFYLPRQADFTHVPASVYFSDRYGRYCVYAMNPSGSSYADLPIPRVGKNQAAPGTVTVKFSFMVPPDVSQTTGLEVFFGLNTPVQWDTAAEGIYFARAGSANLVNGHRAWAYDSDGAAVSSGAQPALARGWHEAELSIGVDGRAVAKVNGTTILDHTHATPSKRNGLWTAGDPYQTRGFYLKYRSSATNDYEGISSIRVSYSD